MGKPLVIYSRPPGGSELTIGRGIPSAHGGNWRIMNVLTSAPMRVFYDNEEFGVEDLEDWEGLPDTGLQVIRCTGGVWKGCDEYRYKGNCPKYGTYLSDDEYFAIENQARNNG